MHSFKSNEFFDLPIEARQDLLLDYFKYFTETEDRYKALMDLRTIPLPLDPSKKSQETLVRGCQSEMHLSISLAHELIHIEIFSESLISLGLASLLFLLFHKTPPKTPFIHSLTALSTGLDFPHLLSTGRSNGFMSMFDHLKKQLVIAISSEVSVKNS